MVEDGTPRRNGFGLTQSWVMGLTYSSPQHLVSKTDQDQKQLRRENGDCRRVEDLLPSSA
jgi:hypothetical protein